GPLLDRIDLHVDVPRVSSAELRPDAAPGESSAVVRVRVEAARARQAARAGVLNAHLDQAGTGAHCCLGARDQALLERAIDSLQLSGLAVHRILRVARTIADLAGADGIGSAHLAEALGYRGIDPRGQPAPALTRPGRRLSVVPLGTIMFVESI